MKNDELSACMPANLARRSLLFVPGSRVDRIAKALNSEADAIIIDLEDAVELSMKDSVRESVVEFLGRVDRTSCSKEIFVRINSIRSSDGMRDLLALVGAPLDGWDGVVLPKVQSEGEVEQVAAILDEQQHPALIGALIETVEGLDNINKIAAASDRMDFLMFGGADFAGDLGVELERLPLEYARIRIIHAAARYGLASVEMPWVRLSDAGGYEDDVEYCFALGFDSRAAIHPSQIRAIHKRLKPSAENVSRAKMIFEAYQKSDGGVFVVDGRLVERPLVLSAQKILARAAATAAKDGA
jgi:(S)-citramalyl-CoA lyase